MKKATILATAISLLTINLYAQTEGYKFGGYIGIGRSSFSIMGEEAYKAMYINNNSAFILTEANAGTSNSVNLSIVKQIKNFIALHADASLSNSTYSYTLKEYDKSKNINNNYSDNFSLTQFTIPVYFKPSLGIAKTVFLKSYFGLAPSINLATNYNRRYETQVDRKEYSKKDIDYNFMSINLITGFGLDFQFGPKSPVFSFDLRISGTPYQFGNSGSLPLGTEKEYRMMIREFSTTFQVGVVQTVNWFDKKLIKN